MALTPALTEELAKTLCPNWEQAEGYDQGAAIETVAHVARRVLNTAQKMYDWMEQRNGGPPKFYADLSAEDQAVWDGKYSHIANALEENEAYIR